MSDRLKKVLVWRMLSFSTAGTISYMYLGEFDRSLVLTSMLTAVMTAIHWLFETIWEA